MSILFIFLASNYTAIKKQSHLGNLPSARISFPVVGSYQTYERHFIIRFHRTQWGEGYSTLGFHQYLELFFHCTLRSFLSNRIFRENLGMFVSPLWTFHLDYSTKHWNILQTLHASLLFISRISTNNSI